MSAIINTGGPAFPCGRDVTLDQWEPEIGMTLRDYFAAKAMHALLNSSHSYDGSWHMEANASFEIADAMIKARSA